MVECLEGMGWKLGIWPPCGGKVASLKLHLENEDHFAHGKSIKDQPDDIVHQQIMALDKPAPFASLIF